jgi:hypothetical protein
VASLTERYTGYKPLTYEVSVAVVGGQFLIYDTANAGKVKVAGAHATNSLGMAKYDAAPGVEFGATSVAYYNVPINSPTPRLVATCHMGVYDVVNAGDATLNPGDPVEIATADGKPGKTATGMVGGLAVVGYCIGLVANGAYSTKPVPAGSVMRLRLGRV